MIRRLISDTGRRRGAVWWRWVGAVTGLLLLAWVLRNFDLSRFADVVATAETWPLLLLPLAVAGEQVLRALKWRQILDPLRTIAVGRLFGATMAGYLANLAAPVRVSPLVRAWLVARVEGMSTSTLLATVALDRFTDGVVFVGYVGLAVAVARFPDPDGQIVTGMAWGGGISLALFVGLIKGLFFFREWLRRDSGSRVLARLTGRLPAKWRGPTADVVRLFADGVVWPRAAWRGAAIVVAAVAIKIVAISHLLLAGLALGVALGVADYLFLMVFLGFLVILAGTLRLVGGYTAGAVFVLGGFGVDVETALAMALLVQAASILTVAACGAGALWIHGISMSRALAGGTGGDPTDARRTPDD